MTLGDTSGAQYQTTFHMAERPRLIFSLHVAAVTTALKTAFVSAGVMRSGVELKLGPSTSVATTAYGFCTLRCDLYLKIKCVVATTAQSH